MGCKWKSKNVICNRPSGEGGYCVLHKKNKNEKEYKNLIRIIKEEKITEIVGVIFEEDFNMKDVVDFEYESLRFKDVIFCKTANFENYQFNGKIYFEKVTFLSKVSFKNSKFLKNCTFSNVKYSRSTLKDKIFINTLVMSQNFELNKIKNQPRLDGIVLDRYTKIIIKDVDYDKEGYLNGKVNYRIARNQANKIGDYERVSYYYYKSRAYGSRCMRKEDFPNYKYYLSAKFFDFLSKHIIGYGEKPWNVLIVTLSVVSVFAFLYMTVGLKNIINNEILIIELDKLNKYKIDEIWNTYIELWYFSMITFSTVGYGDIVPINNIGKIIASAEVFFGITIGATWTSVILKRMIK